ncbi:MULTISPECIES: cell wall metabolism sensor histidine kinase WalK [Paenibacillus]|uniref:sensor histidine kinase n=1 Tax=Paenibacillus TaxID=44249 RepID=UPI000837F501|nr:MULTISPECIES: HAMP domain-containing sensor histidine kinase [Paenibacillus]GIP21577.1 two-component sensor histidine kinase [Paenibacillus sp. J22TS3]
MKKFKQVMKDVLGLILLAILAACSATVAHYIIAKYEGRPFIEGYVLDLIFFGSGLFLFIITIVIISLFFRRREIRKLNKIIEAMKRLSKGDFSVRLDSKEYHDEGFEKVVEMINEMASELGNMETMRQDFISNVSHEIQSPLTSIGGFARVLLEQDKISSDTKRHYLDIIESESQRLSKLSDNLLKLTALESAEPIFEKIPYRLDKQIQRVVLASETQWSAKELNVELDLEEATIKAEEDLMSQVWINLLHNSIKFTKPGGWIRIELKKTTGSIKVKISDNGVGISPENMPHIFERFYKADKSRNREAGGSGLGLSLVKKIVEIHEGEVSAASVLGEGTQFTVTLYK